MHSYHGTSLPSSCLVWHATPTTLVLVLLLLLPFAALHTGFMAWLDCTQRIMLYDSLASCTQDGPALISSIARLAEVPLTHKHPHAHTVHSTSSRSPNPTSSAAESRSRRGCRVADAAPPSPLQKPLQTVSAMHQLPSYLSQHAGQRLEPDIGTRSLFSLPAISLSFGRLPHTNRQPEHLPL